MFIYKASRYFAPVEDEYKTLREAVERARSDSEHGEACPLEITDAEGRVVLDRAALVEAIAGRPVAVGMTEDGARFKV
jgi:hypothetical protein